MKSEKISSSNEETMSIKKQTSQVILAVSLYWTVSILMVFLNKFLLSSDDLKFDAPFFITWYQCVVTVGLCGVLAYVASKGYITFPEFKIEPQIAKQVLPLSFVFVGMIICNNLCLKHVSISFYMVVRSLTTVFNVLLTYWFFGVKTSAKALGCCGIIICGFLLGIDQEKGLGTISFFGVFFGVSGSLFVALNAVFTKKTLAVVDQNIWKLTLYNNFNACLIFLPFILLREVNEILTFPKLFDSYFVFAMTVAGGLGFSMGYVTSFQIKATSPLTHNVSGTAKSYVQTFLGVVYYSEVKTMLWWLSNVFVLTGAGLYSHVRNTEMKANAAPILPEKQGNRD